MNRFQYHIRRSAHLVASLAILGLLSAGCEEEQVITTTRNLDRPGPMALACTSRVGDAGVTTGLPQESCSSDGGGGSLFGFVANTSRGHVAIFRPVRNSEPLVDLDRGSPGFGFIPVGSLPTSIKSSRDGCRVVSANSGSCDLSVIDVPGVLDVAASELKRPYGGVVSRVLPRTQSGRLLRARPQEVVLVPSSVPCKANSSCGSGAYCDDSGACVESTACTRDEDCAGLEGAFTCDGRRTCVPATTSRPDHQLCPHPGAYRAYVTFPRCNLVAEIDLATGLVLQGIVITDTGFYPTKEPRCPVECIARGDPGRVDSGPLDLGPPPDAPVPDAPPAPDGSPPDAGAPSDSGPSDAQPDSGPAIPDLPQPGPVDGGSADADTTTAFGVSADGVLPYGLAVTELGDRLFVSSAGAGFVSQLGVNPETGAFENPRRIELSDGVWTTKIRLSPRPRNEELGRFLYLIARDRSVRVIQVEVPPGGPGATTSLFRECETNLDLLKLVDGGVFAKTAGNGDAGAPLRDLQVALDKARCFVVGAAGTPPRRVLSTKTGLRFGTRLPMDVIFVSSGLDAGPDGGGEADAGSVKATPLSGIFALVAVSDGTVYVIDVEDLNQVRGDAGTVSWLSVPHRIRNGLQGTATGVPDAGVVSVTGGGAGGIPVVVSRAGADGGSELPGEGTFVRGVGEQLSTTWNLVYEERLVGRWSGNLRVRSDGLTLSDRGADFCASGVLGRQQDGDGRPIRHGDILVLVGCKNDDECGLEQVCSKPVTQETEYGLCFDRDRETELFDRCRDFLRGRREYLVTGASQDALMIDVLPVEPQKIIRCTQDKLVKDKASCADHCTSNDDCPKHHLCALRDREIDGRPDLSLQAGECFRPGCETDADCGGDGNVCVAPLDGSPPVCSTVALPLIRGPKCPNGDDDCICRSRSECPKLNSSCTRDKDCDDGRLECIKASTMATSKTCQPRQMTCAEFVEMKGYCVAKSPCFRELLRYDVRAGRSFVLGSHRRVIADPQTGQCGPDPEKSPLLVNRIPVGLPVYPVLVGPECQNAADLSPLPLDQATLALPQPNPCFELVTQGYSVIVDRSGAATTLASDPGSPAAVVRFSNPDIWLSLGVSHLSTPVAASSGGATGTSADGGLSATVFTPMPERGLNIELSVGSGYSRMATQTLSTISLPVQLVEGPDSFVYVVDMGDRTGTTGTRGQVVRLKRAEMTLDNFIVR